MLYLFIVVCPQMHTFLYSLYFISSAEAQLGDSLDHIRSPNSIELVDCLV